MDSKRCYHVMVWFVVLRLTTMRLAAMTLVAARFACVQSSPYCMKALGLMNFVKLLGFMDL